MPRYEVVIHHKVGSQFLIDAETEEEASEMANRRMGEDGVGDATLYDDVEEVEVQQI